MVLRQVVLGVALLATLTPLAALAANAPASAISPADVDATIAALVARHGDAHAARIRTGVRQVAARWWAEDGDAAAFAAFCQRSFVADPQALAAAFARLEVVSEQVYGHLHEISRELRTPVDLDRGPISPVDRLLADFDLGNHVSDDLFKTKVAFYALLNFPVHTLAERLAAGATWDRETWARSRLMDGFAVRVPAAVSQTITSAMSASEQYISEYNIRLDRVTTPEGRRLFPEGLRLISHWGLRDELASHYAEADGLAKQRMIQRVMERIVRQEIPAAAIDNPDVEWCPESNTVKALAGAKVRDAAALGTREPDDRYARWIANFVALRGADPYSPTAPTFIARSFEIAKQIPEKDVEAMLRTILAAPEVRALGALISKRLGRPIEPFDIWYSGFRSRGNRSEAELDALCKSRYPTVAAFQTDLPRILTTLGFSKEKAEWLAARIVVDPARGSGHAMGAVRRDDKAHLRTRVGQGGMDYKGYNIAIHELGHNVEQVFSLDGIDHWLLSGVPNTAFTEAFAFAFQARDLELLGLPAGDSAKDDTEALAGLWNTYEIGGVSLVDLYAWRWLYAHPQASPAELREAVLGAARDVWNRYYAPVFGVKDQVILAIYSHMINAPLYLSNYAIGHIIDYQLGAKLFGASFGAEFERMARQGTLTPEGWMRGAVGAPISPQALLEAAHVALANAK